MPTEVDVKFSDTDSTVDAKLSGDAAFFVSVNKTLDNIRQLKACHPGVSTVVTFVTNQAGEQFKLVFT